MLVEQYILSKIYTDKKLKGVTSAYDLWLSQGNSGSLDEFFESLAPNISFSINEQGELEVDINGNS